jgi:Uri superfamily endonuclease
MLKRDLLKYRSSDLLQDMDKGTYVLILFLEHDKKIMVGRGGRSSCILFRSGYYAYVGSAYGPGGLRSRIKRHLIKDKKCVWHIDYLRKEAVPIEVWVDVHDKKQEKIWADALINMKGSHPVENFGNTDDRKTRTHLCYFNALPSFRFFRQCITKSDHILNYE